MFFFFYIIGQHQTNPLIEWSHEYHGNVQFDADKKDSGKGKAMTRLKSIVYFHFYRMYVNVEKLIFFLVTKNIFHPNKRRVLLINSTVDPTTKYKPISSIHSISFNYSVWTQKLNKNLNTYQKSNDEESSSSVMSKNCIYNINKGIQIKKK